jgi:hypothetical protein
LEFLWNLDAWDLELILNGGILADKRGRRLIVRIYQRFILATDRTTKVVHDQNHIAKRKTSCARMRTLLNEALPPHLNDEPALSRPQKFKPLPRIFSKSVVLSNSEPMEVGMDGAIIATPGACANLAKNASGRGNAALRADAQQLRKSPTL